MGSRRKLHLLEGHASQTGSEIRISSSTSHGVTSSTEGVDFFLALMFEILMPLVDSLFDICFERPHQKAEIVGFDSSILPFQMAAGRAERELLRLLLAEVLLDAAAAKR